MNTRSIHSVPQGQRASARSQRQRRICSRHAQTDDGFLCKNCKKFVPSAEILSGVQNRNHCPYCLWSRHLDLNKAGDRLSACKAPMQPVGVMVKITGKRYCRGYGELMLIHLCTECSSFSINRIAADDIPEFVFAVFEDSFGLDTALRARLEANSIAPLTNIDRVQVHTLLFGRGSGLAEALFSGRNVSKVLQED
jgi:hypothetical protein